MFSLFMSFERDMRATLDHYVVSTLGIDDTLGELVKNALLRQIKGDDPDSSLPEEYRIERLISPVTVRLKF